MSTLENDVEKKDDRQVNFYSVLVAVIAGLTWGASFISRNVWSSAIASEATLTSLGITALQAGGIATAFYVGYVASNFFSGWLIDAIGARWSLAITALGTGLATLAIPFTSGYWVMFLLRVVAGIFAGPLFSCIVKFNLAYFPDKYRAIVTGFMGAGSALGQAVASIWFTPMVASKGYRVAFIWAGIVTAVVGVFVLLIIRDKGVTKPIKNMEALSEEEKKNATKGALKVFLQKDFLPIQVSASFDFAIDYFGYSAVKDQYNPKLTYELADKLAQMLEGDTLPMAAFCQSPIYRYAKQKFMVPGDDGFIQHPNLSPMELDEYPEFIEDPLKFIVEKIHPRVFGLIEDDPEYGQLKISIARNILAQQYQGLGPNLTDKYERANVQVAPIILWAPLDFIADYIRNFSNILTDIRRKPQWVLDACEAACCLFAEMIVYMPICVTDLIIRTLEEQACSCPGDGSLLIVIPKESMKKVSQNMEKRAPGGYMMLYTETINIWYI